MFAPTPGLIIDKRIVQTANSLAAAGHLVSVIAPPQIGSKRDLSELFVEGVELMEFEADFPEARSLDPLSELSHGRIWTWICSVVRRIVYSNAPESPRLRAKVRAFLKRVAHKQLFPRLSNRNRLHSFFFFFQVGPSRFFRYDSVFSLNIFNWWYFFRGLLVHRRRPVDFIYCHDLWCLPPGVLLKEILGAKLSYDSHEIATTIFEDPALKKLAEKEEGRLYAKTDKFLTVNPSVANYYRTKFPFLDPTVIVNAPPLREPSRDQVSLKERLGCETATLAVYVGNIRPELRWEHIIESLLKAKADLRLAIVGDGIGREALEDHCQKRGLTGKKIYFIPRVSFHQVFDTIYGADFGLVPHVHGWLNLGMNSSSKVYDYIQAGLPVISDPGKEMQAIVEGNGIGELVDFHLPAEDLAKKFDAFAKRVERGDFRSSCEKARRVLVWPEDLSDRVLPKTPVLH